MPTNLPPEYYEVDKRYRSAKTPEEKVALLEELISTVPKHKGTDKLRADLRDRLSKLKAALQSRKKVSRQSSAFRIDREGAGQVVLIGPTNVGKSALLARLTNAEPEVSEYPYTTWSPTPGMMEVDYVQIQLIDTPPLDRDYIIPEMIDLVRRADLILIVVDLTTHPIQQLQDTVAILEENRIVPSHLKDRYPNPQRISFVPLLVLVNKADDADADEIYEIFCQLIEDTWPCIPISAKKGRNLDKFGQAIINELGIIRVFTKPPGKDIDLTKPFVLKKGSTVEDMAGIIHNDFYKNLKSARVWGSGVFEGQMVGRDYILQDGDVVELRT